MQSWYVLVLSLYRIHSVLQLTRSHFFRDRNMMFYWSIYFQMDIWTSLFGINIYKVLWICSLPYLILDANNVQGYCSILCLVLFFSIVENNLTAKSKRKLNNVFFVLQWLEIGAGLLKKVGFLQQHFVSHPEQEYKKPSLPIIIIGPTDNKY